MLEGIIIGVVIGVVACALVATAFWASYYAD